MCGCFLAHDFRISLGMKSEDTAAFRPEIDSLVHYKNEERYFLVNIYANGKFGIDQFATGNKDSRSGEGTWKDAEDGLLSGNLIAQGSVDSVVGIPMTLEPQTSSRCYYWIAAGKSWDEVKALNTSVKKRTPEAIFERTRDYWKLWVDKQQLNYDPAAPEGGAALSTLSPHCQNAHQQLRQHHRCQ